MNILHETRILVAQSVSLLNEIKVATDMMIRLKVGKRDRISTLIGSTSDIKKKLIELNEDMIIYNNTSNKTDDMVSAIRQKCFTLRSFITDTDRLFRDVLRT